MNIENTNLLLNDLSSRLNYNVKLHVNYNKMYKNAYCSELHPPKGGVLLDSMTSLA